jgi:VIT1/CCC1 family predicted Fe2+/Mn2+ transporter
MAAGEYVSVYAQADTERAALELERDELATNSAAEHRELAAIYVSRGLDSELATRVADQLMQHNAMDAHARDELGISTTFGARPIQAAVASAASFSVGAVLPLLVVVLAPQTTLIWLVCVTSLVFLAVLGGVSAQTGGANVWVAAWRVTFWGALAMAITAGVGFLFGAVV